MIVDLSGLLRSTRTVFSDIAFLRGQNTFGSGIRIDTRQRRSIGTKEGEEKATLFDALDERRHLRLVWRRFG